MAILKTNSKTNKKASFIFIMVAFAFMVKSIFPAGFMPVVNKDGYTEIIICSGMGEKIITVPLEEDGSPSHISFDDNKICAYQILASGKFLSTPPILVIHAPIFAKVHIAILNSQNFKGIDYLPFVARGPPTFLI